MKKEAAKAETIARLIEEYVDDGDEQAFERCCDAIYDAGYEAARPAPADEEVRRERELYDNDTINRLRVQIDELKEQLLEAIEVGSSQAADWQRYWDAVGIGTADITVDDAIRLWQEREQRLTELKWKDRFSVKPVPADEEVREAVEQVSTMLETWAAGGELSPHEDKAIRTLIAAVSGDEQKEQKTARIIIWWELNDGSQNIETEKSEMTGAEIMEAAKSRGWLRPWQKILVEMLPNGTNRIIGQSDVIRLHQFMKFSAIGNDDND